MTDRDREWISDRWVAIVVVAVTLAALAVRFYALGYRVSHYDEGRVGYWVLQFIETGYWEYRPQVHGPFFIRINSVVFEVLGASDFTSRLVVALIGGFLPLSAWLFRKHLRPEETVALSLILAFNPILLYYSRFMRNDLPLAAFMFVALGLFVRAYDTGQARYLCAGGVSFGLAFTTKESALLWVVTLIGAGALILDRVFLRERDRADSAVAAVRSLLDRAAGRLRTWALHLVVACVLFLVVIVFFYAPRTPNEANTGLWSALGDDVRLLPAVIGEATLGSVHEVHAVWINGVQNHAYLPYLMDTLRTLAAGALGVCVLAVVGFGYNRYANKTKRDLVVFSFYSGVAAIVGYPLANLLPVSWSTIHAIIPLAVPAAVGAGVLYRWGQGQLPSVFHSHERDALPATDSLWVLRVGVAIAVLTAIAVNAGAVALETSYLRPHDSPSGTVGGNEIVYYSQPPGELRPAINAIEHAAANGGSDTDVLYVGDKLATTESNAELPPGPGEWYARIPIPWYTEAFDADVASVDTVTGISTDPPPVIITDPANRTAVSQQLSDEYVSRLHLLDDAGDRKLVFFIKRNLKQGNGTVT